MKQIDYAGFVSLTLTGDRSSQSVRTVALLASVQQSS